METWKEVPGYGSLYEASDQGNVRSLGRVETVNNRWGGTTSRTKKAKLLKQGETAGRRYKSVGLHGIDGIVKTFEIHCLVALTFIGERPLGLCVCHNDGDSKNNRLDNLRFDTYQSNNNMDKKIHGSFLDGERISWASLTNLNVEQIRIRYAANESPESLAVEFSTNANNIRRICRGERFKSANGPITRRYDESKVNKSAQ